MKSNKETAKILVQHIAIDDENIAQWIDFEVLKIHSPEVENTLESKQHYFSNAEKNTTIEIARILEDGQKVAMHFKKVAAGKSTIHINVYHFNDDGKLIEIWTNEQEELPARADGTTMLNGETTIKDFEKTEENRKLTNDIYQKVQIEGEVHRMPDFFVNGKMIQHNVMMEDDLAGMGVFLGKLEAEGRTEKINSYELCVCEGNFSITATNANFGKEPMAFFDIQRWENGKVMEHWDVVAPMPAADEWKNDWGKFNFFQK